MSPTLPEKLLLMCSPSPGFDGDREREPEPPGLSLAETLAEAERAARLHASCFACIRWTAIRYSASAELSTGFDTGGTGGGGDEKDDEDGLTIVMMNVKCGRVFDG